MSATHDPYGLAGSPLTRYVHGREFVLGARTCVADDPDVAFEQLCQRHGGRAPARRWLLEVLAAADLRGVR